jgi:hypothetical protein
LSGTVISEARVEQDNLDQSRLGFHIDEATFDQNAISIKLNSIRAELKGTISGNKLSGHFTSSGRSADVELERIQ